MKSSIILIIFLSFIIKVSLGQNTGSFNLHPLKETGLLVGAGSMLLFGQLKIRNQTILTQSQINDLNANDIFWIDRFATNRSSLLASNISDLGVGVGLLSTGVLLLQKPTRHNLIKIAIVGFETMLLTTGLTYTTKALAQRIRPYMYNNYNVFDKGSTDMKQSFFSGHTSVTAAACFFTAYTASTYLNNKNLNKYLWIGAFTIPAFVGSMRIAAGKHFLTDVLVGYGVGASLGVLVPKLHTVKPTNKQLSLSPHLNGFSLNYSF
ncbi:MAG: phosphatase PAP2 family protein [Bacteroidia bacterium]